jgi:aminopeptidase
MPCRRVPWPEFQQYLDNLDLPDPKEAGTESNNNSVREMRISALFAFLLVVGAGPVFAQQAETDEDTLTEMFFRACLLDWEQATKTWQAWADALQGSQEVHILGRGTDLRFSVRGRRWVVLDGRINMPDGEILTAPVNETLDGYISFELPGVFGGRLIPDIHLAWERGRLVEARASRHQDFLHDILATDGGSCLLGEFAFGLNPHVNRFCRDPLIDEKIGGTIHIALGRAYPECGGDNPSAIHWDIVKDMREEGMVLVDGKGVLTKGHWNFSMPGR